MPHVHETDNETARLAAVTGASSALRYVKRHQKVSLTFLRDLFRAVNKQGESCRECHYINTKENTSDYMTKALTPGEYLRHREGSDVVDVSAYQAYEIQGKELDWRDDRAVRQQQTQQRQQQQTQQQQQQVNATESKMKLAKDMATAYARRAIEFGEDGCGSDNRTGYFDEAL